MQRCWLRPMTNSPSRVRTRSILSGVPNDGARRNLQTNQNPSESIPPRLKKGSDMIQFLKRTYLIAGLVSVIGIVLLTYARPVQADCYCTCMNGENQPICDSAIVLRPICPPKICPLEPPSIEPIQPPTLPPLGTEVCVQEQVWDYNLGEYVWKTICY